MTNPSQNEFFSALDSLYQSQIGRTTGGVSPISQGLDLAYWLGQLAMAPGKMLEIMTFPYANSQKIVDRLTNENGPGGKDPRFKSEGWKHWPYRLYATTFLTMEDWLLSSTCGVSGLDKRTGDAVNFALSQITEAMNPGNFPLMNPDVIKETLTTGGQNWVNGYKNLQEDIERKINNKGPVGVEDFKPGEKIAITPGKVVFRNDLIELIQYTPTTETVYKEPILIVPAWIMKYYILDLAPQTSMVRWLVSQGHTVFIISWHNPTEKDRNVDFDDYYRRGSMAAIDAVSAIVPQQRIHLTGYCLGGTLSLVTAATMAANGDNRLQSLTMFAAQGDFTEAGELLHFINRSKISFIEQLTKTVGYLDTKQMASTFVFLRSYDMIWSKIVREYMLGQRDKMIDLMAWNADATRMPHKMYCTYLDQLYIGNDFVEGRFKVEGKPVAPNNIQVPVFAVGTEKDHVVPWSSAHKIHLMIPGSVTFALTSGGHNAGIVTEPGHKRRYYRLHERRAGEPYLDPETWFKTAELHQEESWWLAWEKWITTRSSPDKVAPPMTGTALPPYQPLCDAPGTYIFEK